MTTTPPLVLAAAVAALEALLDEPQPERAARLARAARALLASTSPAPAPPPSLLRVLDGMPQAAVPPAVSASRRAAFTELVAAFAQALLARSGARVFASLVEASAAASTLCSANTFELDPDPLALELLVRSGEQAFGARAPTVPQQELASAVIALCHARVEGTLLLRFVELCLGEGEGEGAAGSASLRPEAKAAVAAFVVAAVAPFALGPSAGAHSAAMLPCCRLALSCGLRAPAPSCPHVTSSGPDVLDPETALTLLRGVVAKTQWSLAVRIALEVLPPPCPSCKHTEGTSVAGLSLAADSARSLRQGRVARQLYTARDTLQAHAAGAAAGMSQTLRRKEVEELSLLNRPFDNLSSEDRARLSSRSIPAAQVLSADIFAGAGASWLHGSSKRGGGTVGSGAAGVASWRPVEPAALPAGVSSSLLASKSSVFVPPAERRASALPIAHAHLAQHRPILSTLSRSTPVPVFSGYEPPAAYEERCVRHALFGLRDPPLALAYAGSSARLQLHCLRSLVGAAEFAMARAALSSLLLRVEGADVVGSGREARLFDAFSMIDIDAAEQLAPLGGRLLLSAAEKGRGFTSYDEALGSGRESSPLPWPAQARPPSASHFWSPTIETALVDTVAAVADMRARIEAEVAAAVEGELVMLGLDSEWRPDHLYDRQSGLSGVRWPTALLQVATPHGAWLIDLLVLRERDVGDLLQWLFQNPSLLKVGFGLVGDLQRLRASHPQLEPATLAISPAAELSDLVDAAHRAELVIFARGSSVDGQARAQLIAGTGLASPSRGSSLSRLVELVLAAPPMDKAEQTSDWQLRPLSKRQMRYAALDAFAVVKIAQRALELGASSRVSCWTGASVPWPRPPPSPLAAEAVFWALASYPEHPLHRALYHPAPSYYHHGPADVRAALARLHADSSQAFLLEHVGKTTTTAASASDVLSVPTTAVIKTLAVFLGAARPALALIPGDLRLDQAKLARIAGVSRRHVRLASALECVRVFGFQPGSFAPVGGRDDDVEIFAATAIATRSCVAPPSLLREAKIQPAAGVTFVFAGGGSEHAMLAISWPQLQSCTHAVVGDICASPVAREATAPTEPPQPRQQQPMAAPVLELVVPRPQFLVDNMLGRLLRWMRVIGVDAASASDACIAPTSAADVAPRWQRADGAEFKGASWRQQRPLCQPVREYHSAIIERANREHRIILTRDRKLLQRKEPVCVYLVSSDDTRAAFDEVCQHFAIKVQPEDLMSRCSRCNGLGYSHMNAAEVTAALRANPMRFDVPVKVLHRIDEFWLCGSCDKLYWEGPKFGDTRASFWRLFDGDDKERREGEAVMVEGAPGAVAVTVAAEGPGEYITGEEKPGGEAVSGSGAGDEVALSRAWFGPRASTSTTTLSPALRAFASKAPDGVLANVMAAMPGIPKQKK